MTKQSIIKRREFMKRLFFGAAGGKALLSAFPLIQKAPSIDKRLNVLFIVADDLRPQLGCYGQKQMITPNIDRLAGQGMLFERAYCQQALCAPSRSSLFSGLRPDTTGIYGLKTRLSDALPKHITLPRYFKQNGYETISIGKVYHHLNDDPQAWSERPTFVEKRSNRYVTAAMQKLSTKNRMTYPKAGYEDGATEIADVPDSAYSDGKNTDIAIGKMTRLKDKPFFICVGYHKPHLPFSAPKKYWDMYDPKKIPLADNPFPPRTMLPHSRSNFRELRSYYGIPKWHLPIPEKTARHLIHGYYACVSFIDAQVGRLLEQLDKLKLRGKTVVILLGDNGWKLGENGSWGKAANSEFDTRVPLIISVPLQKSHVWRTKALVEFVDIYPTLCEVCGLRLPKLAHPLEGCSFAPILENPERPWKRAAFSQYPHGNLETKDPDHRIMGYTMRTDRYRYSEWKRLSSGKIEGRELYDHDSDPQENVNVAAEARYAKIIKELAEMMKRGWKGALPK